MPVRAVYEAGPTGFGLARAARAAGIEMYGLLRRARFRVSRATGSRPTSATSLKLARLHAAGSAAGGVGPRSAAGGGCAGSRAGAGGPARRSDGVPDPGSQSCCCVAAWSGRGPVSTRGVSAHLSWLSRVRFDDRGARRAGLLRAPGLPRGAARRAALRRPARAGDRRAGREGRAFGRGLVGRLRCLRGVDTLTAVGLVAEVGDSFRRSITRARLASYVGLVPSGRARPAPGACRGAITKAGIGARPPALSLKRPGTNAARRA